MCAPRHLRVLCSIFYLYTTQMSSVSHFRRPSLSISVSPSRSRCCSSKLPFRISRYNPQFLTSILLARSLIANSSLLRGFYRFYFILFFFALLLSYFCMRARTDLSSQIMCVYIVPVDRLLYYPRPEADVWTVHEQERGDNERGVPSLVLERGSKMVVKSLLEAGSSSFPT